MAIQRDRYGYESSPQRADRFASMFAPAVVDLFAGCGGWSIGTEQAFTEAGLTDRYIDLMVNHWDVAVGVHNANHLMTEHLRASVFDVDPSSVLPGRRIAYLHASPDCFPAGTLVLTDRGYRPIEGITVGERVLTHKGRWRTVTSTMSSIKWVRRLRLHGHPGLAVSDEHPFLARQRSTTWDSHTRRAVSSLGEVSWVKAADLKRGEYRYKYADGRRTGLDGGHYVASVHRFPELPIPNVGGRGMPFDHRLMWLAGRYVGDGWTRLTDTRAELVITCGKHEVDNLRVLLNQWPRTGARSDAGELAWHERETTTAYQFTTDHRGLVEWLRANFGHRAECKSFPAWALGMPVFARRSLLEGYLSADGSRRNGKTDCTTVSKALAYSSRSLAMSLGRTVAVYFGQNRDIIQGRKVRARDVYSVRWFDSIQKGRSQTERDDQFEWCPLRESSEPTHIEPVYNLAVEEDESYVVEGFVVHNCTHFSKARGSRPKKKDIRGLAWVIVDWAVKRRPDVITCENVEEFKTWGPLQRDGQPCPRRRGQTFARWVKALQGLGYVVEHRELRACDYGAPTTRKRLFVIARCDGKPIVWPEKTHGPRLEDGDRSPERETDQSFGRSAAGSAEGRHANRRGRHLGPVPNGRADRSGSGAIGDSRHTHGAMKPYRTASECIDWKIPMLSIFATPEEAKAFGQLHGVGTPRRPLKAKTLARIAAGLVKYVLQSQRPFIVDIENAGWNANGTRGVDGPLNTLTATPKGGKHAVVDAKLAPYTAGVGGRAGQSPSTAVNRPLSTITGKADRVVAAATLQTLNHSGPEHRAQSPADPLQTITGANDARALVAALVTKHYGDSGQRPGHSPEEPLSTITASDHNALTVAHLLKFRGSSEGTPADEPCPTITGGGDASRDAGAAHALGVSAVYLSQMYGTNKGTNGAPDQPAPAITGTGQHATAVAAKLAPFMVGSGGAAYAAKPKAIDEPANTVMVNDRRALVSAFLATYYSQGSGKTGQPIDAPSPTIVGKDRIQLVTVIIDGTTYVVTDIAMRMLQPHELKRAQGFPDDYIIDHTVDGKPVSKADQVRLIGNSVPPAFARAIVRTNVVEQGVLDERTVAAGRAS